MTTSNAKRVRACALFALTLTCALSAHAGSIRFFGTGANDTDRVKIRIDDPDNSNPGPPADIGDGAFTFTIEFWIKGSATDNNNSVRCGPGVYGWIDGDIVVDRDRFGQPRSWGLSLGGGRVAFGVNVTDANITTVCGNTSVLNNQWRHVAVTRAASGTIEIFVDGSRDVSSAGPSGDLSYPDNGQPSGSACGGSCRNSDPFIVLGAEKHDAAPGQLAFNGFLDELRLSTSVRYNANFTPSASPFTPDGATAALYHFDEATSGPCATDTVITDAAAGGASPGICRFGNGGPEWSADTPFGAAPGTLQFSNATVPTVEGAGNLMLTVTRAGGSSGVVGVDYATANGTAIAPDDYGATSGTLSFASGIVSRTLSVPIVDDALTDAGESFTVNLGATTGGATLGSPASVTVPITDNDSPGTLQLSAASYAVTEGTPMRAFTVTRLSGSAGAVTVNYATTDGTAIQANDYVQANGTLNWAAGDTGVRNVPVTIVDDTQIETAETFRVTLSTASGGATVGAPNSATITITDNDSAGSLQFSAPTYSVSEAGGTATLTVNRLGGTIGAVAVNYTTSNGTAIAPGDYTATSGTLNWSNGEGGSQTFTIAVADDAAVEGAESLNINLSGASGSAVIGSPGSATLTIADNDVAQSGTLQLTQATFTVGENAGAVTITVSRTGGSDGTAQVRVASSDGTALAGSDFQLLNQTLNWASGDAGSKSATLTITNDSANESAESFTLNLLGINGAALGTPSTATVTINDDDPQGGDSGDGGGGGRMDLYLIALAMLLALRNHAAARARRGRVGAHRARL